MLEHVGEPRDFAAEGFEPRDHVELGRILGAIDIERGAKVSGARFYYLTGARRRPRAGAGQHGDGPGPRRRLHDRDPAGAGPAAGDGGHRLPRPGRRRRLPHRGGGPLPRRHLRGAARGVPLRRDPRQPDAAAAATRRSAPATARRPAPTARTPAASSGCTGSTRWRCSPTPPSRSRTPSTSGCSRGRRSSSTKLGLAFRVIDVAAGDLGLSRAAQVRLRGVDPDPGQVPRAHLDLATAPTSRPAGSTSAAGSPRAPSRWPRSTARCAR